MPKKITIDKKEYFTLKDFCALTEKSAPVIHRYVKYGNGFRKMKGIKFNNNIYIEVSELTDFPFSLGGNSRRHYHYSKDGFMLEPHED